MKIFSRDLWLTTATSGPPGGRDGGHDGALLVTDDANNTLWRVAYQGSAGDKPAEPGSN